MWNENIIFYATLARPKAGVRFDSGNEFANDLEEVVEKVNAALRRYFDKKKLIMIYGGDFDKGKTPAEQKAF